MIREVQVGLGVIVMSIATDVTQVAPVVGIPAALLAWFIFLRPVIDAAEAHDAKQTKRRRP